MLGVERWDVDRLDADRMGVCTKMSWELRSLLTKGLLHFCYVHEKKMFSNMDLAFTVNLRTYCARNYIIQGREAHASTFHRDIDRVFEDKAHRWSREMKKYSVMFNRIEKRLDGAFEQNQQMQKRIKRINHKPNDHEKDIQLLLYLEGKKRA